MSKISNTEKPSRIGSTLRNGSSIPDYKYTPPPLLHHWKTKNKYL